MKRTKRRYLLLQIVLAKGEEETLDPKTFLNAVWGAVTRLYGEHGASLTNLALVDYDNEAKRAILRTNLATLEQVRASIASIATISDKQVAVHILAISGTIKSLHKHQKSTNTLTPT